MRSRVPSDGVPVTALATMFCHSQSRSWEVSERGVASSVTNYPRCKTKSQV